MVGQPQTGRQPLGSLLRAGVRPQPAPLAHLQHLRSLQEKPRRLLTPPVPQPALQGARGLPVQRPLAQPLQPAAAIREPLRPEALVQLRAGQRLLQREVPEPLRPPPLQQPLRLQALREPQPHRQEIREVPEPQSWLLKTLISQQEAEVWLPKSPFQHLPHQAPSQLQPGSRAQQEEEGASGRRSRRCQGGRQGGQGLACFPG